MYEEESALLNIWSHSEVPDTTFKKEIMYFQYIIFIVMLWILLARYKYYKRLQ